MCSEFISVATFNHNLALINGFYIHLWPIWECADTQWHYTVTSMQSSLCSKFLCLLHVWIIRSILEEKWPEDLCEFFVHKTLVMTELVIEPPFPNKRISCGIHPLHFSFHTIPRKRWSRKKRLYSLTFEIGSSLPLYLGFLSTWIQSTKFTFQILWCSYKEKVWETRPDWCRSETDLRQIWSALSSTYHVIYELYHIDEQTAEFDVCFSPWTDSWVMKMLIWDKKCFWLLLFETPALIAHPSAERQHLMCAKWNHRRKERDVHQRLFIK